MGQDTLVGRLAEIRHRQGRLLGRMEGLGFTLQKEAELETLTLDALKTSEIEGEKLDPEQVRSFIARRLGLDAGGTMPADRDVEGVIEMILDATQKFAAPLSEDRLFGWHAALFPTGRSGMGKILVGAWRDDADGSMQVSAQRFYSMSARIRQECNDYYDILEQTQKGTLDVTPWQEWFLGCLGRASNGTEAALATVMRKSSVLERAFRLPTNERQRLLLNRLLDRFEGTLTTKKWALLAKSSHDTALRDIQSLIDQGLLSKDESGGRSTSYSVVL